MIMHALIYAQMNESVQNSRNLQAERGIYSEPHVSQVIGNLQCFTWNEIIYTSSVMKKFNFVTDELAHFVFFPFSDENSRHSSILSFMYAYTNYQPVSTSTHQQTRK